MPYLNVPISEQLRRRAKAAAAARGQTLKDFTIEALERAVRDAESKRRRPKGK
jgi:predicted HicB family RNase H-like nuclease